MHQGPVSSSRFPDLFPTGPHVSAAWKTFSLHVIDVPLQTKAAPAYKKAMFADNLMGLVISGKHRVRHTVDARTREGYSYPGTVSFVPAGREIMMEGNACPRVVAALFVPDAFLHRVIAEHWEADPRKVEIFWQFQVPDPVVQSVVTSLALEAKNQSPSGQLYSESACEFLAHHIIRSYSSLSSPAPRRNGGLPGGRQKLVLDYIEDNLSRPITLRELAALAGVSPRHFGRAFRQALGVPPHAYVLSRRLDTARDLLINQRFLTIDEISVMTGFSSSSHLASAFHRHFGYSPVALRKQ